MQINDTLQTLLKRCSVRNYLPQMIEPDKIQKLKQVINNAPTSMNIQSFSAVFITNKAIKHQMML
jgi:nitroreductase